MWEMSSQCSMQSILHGAWISLPQHSFGTSWLQVCIVFCGGSLPLLMSYFMYYAVL